MFRRLVLLVIVMLGAAATAVPAAATTTRVEVRGTGQVVEVLDAGRTWVSGGVMHVRGQVLRTVQIIDGFPTSTGVATVNVNLHLTTSHGTAWGTTRTDAGGEGFEGTWQGPVSPDPSVPGGLVGEFRIVARGWGAATGTQLRATSTEIIATGQQSIVGYLFVPGDR